MSPYLYLYRFSLKQYLTILSIAEGHDFLELLVTLIQLSLIRRHSSFQQSSETVTVTTF